MSHPQSEYTIRFAGLADGSQVFDFIIHKDFFMNYYPDTEILDSDVKVHIIADKTPVMLILEMNISGKITVECDRCLDPCEVPVKTSKTVIFTSSGNDDGRRKEDDSIVSVNAETESILLDEYLYDFTILALPLRRVHDELDGKNSRCNQEMLERIKGQRVILKEDPRWEKLKNLKEDN